MRPPVDEKRIRIFARELGRVARGPARIYLTGGSTAVLEGWREATIDVDLRIERGFEQDLADVRSMLSAGLVETPRLQALYERIEPDLYRYPAIDPSAFRRKLDSVLRW
jgi:hypothetical protein